MSIRNNLMLFKNICYRQKWRTSNISCFNYSFNNSEAPDLASRGNQLNNKNYKSQSHENDHFHKILASNKKYTNTIAFLDDINVVQCSMDVSTILKNDLTSTSNHVLVDYMKIILKNIGNHSEIFDDPAFTKFCKQLQSKIQNLSDENLLHLLKIMILWSQNRRNYLFYELCKTLDDELLKRSRAWGRDKLILFMDHLYRLNILKYSGFFWRAAKRFFNNPERSTSAQLVHLMFLINSHRRWIAGINTYDLEVALSQIVYELSTEEVAIVALGFFKSENRIRNKELLNVIFRKIESRMSSVDSITLTAILKVLRYSATHASRQDITDILDKAIDRIDDVSLICCTHLALLGTQILVFHPECLKKICVRFVKEISSVRLKDLERIMFILELFDFNPQTEPDIFDSTIQELSQRDKEIREFPKVFTQTLHYLAIRNIYNYDLLHKALSEEFIKYSCNISNNFIPRDVLQLSCSVRLDCSDYTGNNLDPKFVREISKNLCWKIPNQSEKYLSTGNRIMLDAKNVLEGIFNGPKFVHYVYVLPYSVRPELIMCLKDKNPVKIPDTIKTMGTVLDLTSPPNIGDWYVFLFYGFGTMITDIEKPVGNLLAKMRHLKILGYKPLLIKEHEWMNLNVDKIAYLKRLIAESD